MQDREIEINAFLNSHGLENATRNALVADASFRRYERLDNRGDISILMDAPPKTNLPVKIFADVTTLLHNAGVSVPQIFQTDFDRGFLLIEDFGNDLFANLCRSNPEMESDLYRAAIDVLLRVQKNAKCDSLPPYDLATYLRESSLALEWYYPAATSNKPRAEQFLALQTLITDATQALEPYDQCTILRDFHAENLLWLPERGGVKRVGLLDYQDALAGHPAYDLVSLLEDARRDTSQKLQSEMKSYFIAQSGFDYATFDQAFHTLGAQRNLKIIGLFTRLAARDGKVQYLDLIQRVWNHLMNDLSHPSLQGLANWVALNLPSPDRATLEKLAGYRHEA
ncbi:aminoglycoside phosphotransferase [Amylibacter ulvae]|uniref:Aminoglycoside phosphotransferase n=1 Tax=Paramylibacter ulvae TaxID=1651968 RepID=A0ABQ3CXG3_9RHOB|nr:phosphotransferase [Amylibacter ulvae]GHA47642.1 aminoglycoside phosphotransferase [Amylibacter ulvae]